MPPSYSGPDTSVIMLTVTGMKRCKAKLFVGVFLRSDKKDWNDVCQQVGGWLQCRVFGAFRSRINVIALLEETKEWSVCVFKIGKSSEE